MPHEAADLEPVVHALQGQDRDDYSTWETRYALLLWLSMLSLVPFDVCTIDSSLTADIETEGTLVKRILDLGKSYLSDPAATRIAAAMCLSSLLTRPDMEGEYLGGFLEWSATVLQGQVTYAEAGASGDDLTSNTFLLSGVMTTLVGLFKLGHREKLEAFIPNLFPHALAIAGRDSSQPLLRKLLTKLFQRIGMTYLPPRVVGWRYDRGQRSLLDNLSTSAATAASASASVSEMSEAKSDGEGKAVDEGEGKDADELEGKAESNASASAEDMTKGEEKDATESDQEDYAEVPEELEDVVEQLLRGLTDRDTIVRWSAAKGIGRITGRLTQMLADDVVASVLTLFSDAEGDMSWHGACLALAELARRGLLLPARLPEAVPLVCRAIHYDIRRGQTSVGAHVRDAACYVCWAFARAYAPQVRGGALHHPAGTNGLTLAFLCSRVVSLTGRAAAAAFQENVGRQGHENFPNGIEVAYAVERGLEILFHSPILTAADFFTLGNRAKAFLEIAPYVGQFELCRPALIAHLESAQLSHWDVDIRSLSAQALAKLSVLSSTVVEDLLPKLVDRCLSPDLLQRQGACMAVAEILLATAQSNRSAGTDLLEALVHLVPEIEKARLYRGRGGEAMRSASCRLIESIALACVPLVVKKQIRLLDTIDECLCSPIEAVQQAAAAALKAHLRSYFPVGDAGPSERLRDRVVGKYLKSLAAAENAAVTRGMALALGALPRKLCSPDATTANESLDQPEAFSLSEPANPSMLTPYAAFEHYKGSGNRG
ncbi:unnamed protein product [Chrysoparadoxa australica]